MGDTSIGPPPLPPPPIPTPPHLCTCSRSYNVHRHDDTAVGKGRTVRSTLALLLDRPTHAAAQRAADAARCSWLELGCVIAGTTTIPSASLPSHLTTLRGRMSSHGPPASGQAAAAAAVAAAGFASPEQQQELAAQVQGWAQQQVGPHGEEVHVGMYRMRGGKRAGSRESTFHLIPGGGEAPAHTRNGVCVGTIVRRVQQPAGGGVPSLPQLQAGLPGKQRPFDYAPFLHCSLAAALLYHYPCSLGLQGGEGVEQVVACLQRAVGVLGSRAAVRYKKGVEGPPSYVTFSGRCVDGGSFGGPERRSGEGGGATAAAALKVVMGGQEPEHVSQPRPGGKRTPGNLTHPARPLLYRDFPRGAWGDPRDAPAPWVAGADYPGVHTPLLVHALPQQCMG